MPKKSKKGGGRSEEERLVQQQQRVQAEEELARRKEETLTLFLKDKLQKEQRNSAVNLLKLDEGWRSILRHGRQAELRTEVQVCRQTFERRLDGKDSVVQKLVLELQEAELQAAQVQRAHLQHLERLRELQDGRLRGQQRLWEDALQHLMSRFSSERTDAQARSQQQRVQLEDLMRSAVHWDQVETSAIHRIYEDSLSWFTSSHQDQMASLNSRKLRIKSSGQPVSTPGPRQHKYSVTDKQEMKDGFSRTLKLLQAQRRRLKDRKTAAQLDSEAQEEDLTAAGGGAERSCFQLQDWLSHARAAARSQLTELSVQGDGAAKRLRGVIGKEETFLRVAEICDKLESKHDVLSPSTSSLPAEEHTQPPAEHLSAALLWREAARRRQDALSAENQQLLFLLRQHQEDGVLGGRCAPLDVSPAPTTLHPPAADRRHTVIEAVHAVKHSL